MIVIPKALMKSVMDGETPQSELEQHILSNYPITDIIKGYAELLIMSEEYVNKPQITVSQEEFDAITSLFKIRGIRTIDGMVIEETRGRKKNKLIKG